MSNGANPFSELIEILKHNGYTNSPLTVIPAQQFFNLLKKAGWDQAWSGKPEPGKTKRAHILEALRNPTRGPRCGIIRLIDFARALESGFARGPDEWISLRYDAKFIVNWQYKGFVTFHPLSEKDLAGVGEEGHGSKT
jgi:hypothetical protein